MKRPGLVLVCVSMLLVGCASTPPENPHVLSGEAAVASVIREGDASAQRGDYETAALLYRQALVQHPPSAETWYRLGMALTYLDEPDQAAWAFRNTLAFDPDHAGALERLGLYFTARGPSDDAAAYLQRLLVVDPDNWRGHNALGVLSDLQADFEGAALHYHAAVELRPDAPLLWNNLGYSRYLAGDYRSAHRHIEAALQLDPDFHAARMNLALVYARQRKYDDALRTMLHAGDDVAAYNDVGYLAFQMGHYARAEAFFVEAIERSPTYNVRANQNLAAVRKAISDEANGG
jgi:Flp pilus assembly protein TadD